MKNKIYNKVFNPFLHFFKSESASGVILLSFAIIMKPVSFGIIFGLVIGKQIGIFGVSYILVKLKVAKLPAQVTKRHLYGASVLGGIGFTMSIFVSSLSFADETVLATAKISIMIASVLAAILGGMIFGLIKLKSEK